MSKETGTIISAKDWMGGMQKSKYLGIQEIRNLDIHREPGSIGVSSLLEKESGSTVTDLIKWWAKNNVNGDIYFGGSGNIYKRTSSGTWSTISGYPVGANPISGVVWKDYLLLSYSASNETRMATYGPLSGTPAWLSNVDDSDGDTINSDSTSTYVPVFLSAEDPNTVYWGTQNKITKLVELTTFNPATDTSFDFVEGSLVLGESQIVRAIEELAYYICVGTEDGDNNSNGYVYPWDRNDFTAAPEFAFKIPADGARTLRQLNGLLYVAGGQKGATYVTNLTNIEPSIDLRDYKIEKDTNYQNKLHIEQWGGGILLGAGSSAGLVNGPNGIYFMKDKAVTFHTLSCGSGENDGGITIGSIIPISEDKYLVAWEDLENNTYGVDAYNDSKRYSSYGAYFITKFYRLNGAVEKTAANRIELILAKPFIAGQGVKVAYRTNSNDSFSDLVTWEYSSLADTTRVAFAHDFGVSSTNVQLKVSVTTPQNTDANVEILEFILR